MARLLIHYTLCDADCGEGRHNPNFKVCERCGAHIHNDIFEVETDAGEVITVGRECFKGVMGFKFGKWHEKALALREVLEEYKKAGYDTILFNVSGRKMWVGRYENRNWRVKDMEVKMTESLLRAGSDLGLWSYDRRNVNWRGYWYMAIDLL